MSGLNQRFTKPSALNWAREFESHILRIVGHPKGNPKTMKKLEFKNDKYRKARGGYSRFLNLSCAKCGSFVALYQKDGPGPLKRMYLDRIFSLDNLVGLDGTAFKKLTPFTCQKCKQVLGAPFLYEKEDRPTFRLFEGSVSKKIAKTKLGSDPSASNTLSKSH